MDLEKAYDRVDWLALWDALKMYGVGGKLLSAIKSFYEEASACLKISGETSEHFEIKVGLRQGCVMSPWLCNIYMDGVMREMKGKVGEVGVGVYAEGRAQCFHVPSVFGYRRRLCIRLRWKGKIKAGKE